MMRLEFSSATTISVPSIRLLHLHVYFKSLSVIFILFFANTNKLQHQNELLQLVTDQGFLGEPNVVWETLSSIDGDGQFVDGQFRTVPPKPESVLSSSSPVPASSSPAQIAMTAEQQIDHE